MSRTLSVAIMLGLAVSCHSARSDDAEGLAVEVRFTNRVHATPVRYVAGEHVPVGMRITGLHTDSEGKLDLIIEADLRDSSGRTILPLPSNRIHQKLPLGGGEVNLGRSMVLPSDAVGRHTLRVTATDQASDKRATAEIDLEIATASTFGLLNLRTALDQKGELATDVFPVGRTLFVMFTANGCAEQEGSMHVECEGILTDLSGRPLVEEPTRFTVKPESSVYGTTGQANAGLYMNLNRSGQFLLKVTIKDAVDGKEAAQVVPILVVGLDSASFQRSATARGQQRR